jgi:asparagine synthase (glutamine-hydrolysing)
MQRYVSLLPKSLAKLIAGTLRSIPAELVDTAMSAISRRSRRLHMQSPGKKLHKIADVLTTTDPQTLYSMLMSYWLRPNDVLRDSDGDLPPLDDGGGWAWPTFAEEAMLWDLQHYLPDDNLAKVDRASMAASLETRLPLLDHRIVELALRTPLNLKIGDGRGKLLLRKALGRYLPRHLIDRPKMGFSVPVAAWLRGPLREWAADLLSMETTARIGLFDPTATRKCWEEHLSGRHDHYLKLWSLLQAHAWATRRT